MIDKGLVPYLHLRRVGRREQLWQVELCMTHACVLGLTLARYLWRQRLCNARNLIDNATGKYTGCFEPRNEQRCARSLAFKARFHSTYLIASYQHEIWRGRAQHSWTADPCWDLFVGHL